METLSRLQQWYRHQCDGDWEHGYGIRIETLDNPGWRVTIDLTGTVLEARRFERVTHQDPIDEHQWIHAWTEDRQFHGACGPDDLLSLIELFLRWADEPTGNLE